MRHGMEVALRMLFMLALLWECLGCHTLRYVAMHATESPMVSDILAVCMMHMLIVA